MVESILTTFIDDFARVFAANQDSADAFTMPADVTSDPTAGVGYWLPNQSSRCTLNNCICAFIIEGTDGQTAEMQCFEVQKVAASRWSHVPVWHLDLTAGTLVAGTDELYVDTLVVSKNLTGLNESAFALSDGSGDFANAIARVRFDMEGALALLFQTKVGTATAVNVLAKGY